MCIVFDTDAHAKREKLFLLLAGSSFDATFVGLMTYDGFSMFIVCNNCVRMDALSLLLVD